MRIKPKNNIQTKAQAEDAMSTLNNIDTQLSKMLMFEAAAISVVRERYAQKQKEQGRETLETQKALLIKELEIYANENAASWGKKTMSTPFGDLGFRTTTPAVVLIKKIAKSFKAALELMVNVYPSFVKIKKDIDKEAILTAERDGNIDEVKLAKCGLKVDQKEDFWIETNASKDLDEAAKKLKAA